MSKLEKLIAELCPDGVEYKTLGEIASISRGGNFQKKDFCDIGVPCIHYGQIYTRYDLFADKTITHITEECARKQKFYINYICLFNYLFISSQMSAKPYFIGSTGILLLW